VQREFERAMRRAQTPEPKTAAADAATPVPAAIPSVSRVLWIAALGLLAGGGVGVGAVFLTKRRPPPSAPIAAPAPVAPPKMEPPPPPPPVAPERAPTIEEPATELVPPPMPRAHAKRSPHAAPSPARAVEKWGADPTPTPTLLIPDR